MTKQQNNDKIQAIRNEFIKSLPQRINKIQVLIDRILMKEWDISNAKAAIYEIHNLRGFSGSHGLRKISEISGVAEKNLQNLIEQNLELSKQNKVDLIADIDNLICKMKNVHDEITNNILAPETNLKASSDIPLLMIVDDDRAFCETLAAQLEALGYNTKYIYDLEDLEQSIHTYKPKAIFMDIIFKYGDCAGTNIIKELRNKDEIHCPVIYMSARDDLNARVSAVRSGGTAFLNKSFTLSELKNTLDIAMPLQKEKSLKVLIIDDDKNMNIYCTAILDSVGIKTECLDSINNLFAVIVNFNPDVILLDMYMPDINGLELATIIRQHQTFSYIPIVIMSGETDINKQFVMRSLGADDFILKPFKPHHLIDVVLNRIQRSKQTRRLIITDGLTGLTLFSKIKDQVLNIMDSCLRYNLDFSLCFIDLDKFKNVNDTYGHLVGDQVLRDFAEFLASRVRRSDIVTRYGGEEFAIIMPYTNSENAQRALNSIRENYAEKINYASPEHFSVTFSGGISSIDKHKTLESLLLASDNALYTAKESGGNKIIVSD